MSKVVGIGAGGHSKVLLDAIALIGRQQVVGLVEERSDRAGQSFAGTEILGGEDALEQLQGYGVSDAFLGVGAIGSNNQIRRDIYLRISGKGFTFVSVVHPQAVLAASVENKDGLFVAAGAVCNAGVRLGENVVVNTAAVIEHDCMLGDHVFIGPGAVLCGDVFVDELAFIGAGARVRQGVRVGAGAVVGMGATVLQDVPAGATVLGVYSGQ